MSEATLNKEVWVSQLIENFYPDSSFLSHTKDFSGMVDNDAINIAEAGVDPDVLINNITYPIPTVQRIDTPIRIELDKFETENTLIRRPEVIEYAYDQLESVIMGHRNTLRAKTAIKAAHAFAPNGNTANTPVILTSGDLYKGRLRIRVEDILNLKEQFDNADIPLENRFLVLHPSHITDLILFDVKSFKEITNIVEGKPNKFAGFGILQFSKPAYYDVATLEKLPFGSIPQEGHSFCSFAFHADEVMKADGEVYMYTRERDPDQRGTVIGFDKRFIAMPIRSKGIGAIVSDIG